MNSEDIRQLDKLSQIEFNRMNIIMREFVYGSRRKEYQQYLDNQIANLYAEAPHGHGWSATKIVNVLHVPWSTIYVAVCRIWGKKKLRTRSQACLLDAHRKMAYWADSTSKYNTSEKMWSKKNYRKETA